MDILKEELDKRATAMEMPQKFAQFGIDMINKVFEQITHMIEEEKKKNIRDFKEKMGLHCK